MPRRYISKKIKTIVADRSKGYCEYCKFLKKYANASFVTEHIKPIALGGTNDLSNLAYACVACNSFKGVFVKATDPQTGKVVPIFHPRQQHWKDHFKWSEDALLIEGLTPTGRATISRLKTNRNALIYFRKLLLLSGEHPPKE